MSVRVSTGEVTCKLGRGDLSHGSTLLHTGYRSLCKDGVRYHFSKVGRLRLPALSTARSSARMSR